MSRCEACGPFCRVPGQFFPTRDFGGESAGVARIIQQFDLVAPSRRNLGSILRLTAISSPTDMICTPLIWMSSSATVSVLRVVRRPVYRLGPRWVLCEWMSSFVSLDHQWTATATATLAPLERPGRLHSFLVANGSS